MQPRAHVLNVLSDEAVLSKSAHLDTAQNKAHPGVCRTLNQNANIGNTHNRLCGSSVGVVTLVSMLKLSRTRSFNLSGIHH